MDEKILKMVADAIEHATANGYADDLNAMSAEELANDMMALDADLARVPFSSLVECVYAVRKGSGK